MKPLPKSGTLVTNVSLLVEKGLLEKKFQKVCVDTSSYILGARKGRDACGKKPSPQLGLGYFNTEDVPVRGEHVFPRII